MGIKEYRATGGNRALLNDYHRKSDSLAQWQINFLPYKDQQYGFDYLGSGYHGIFSDSEYYPYLSANYDLRYKSVECGKTDNVIVDFGSYPERDSVVFKDKWGVKLKVSKGNILNFSGVTDADTNYIYAYRGDEKIGKLSVNTYKKKSYKVVLVSVNKATLPDINKLNEYLGKVYRQCVDTFEIETDMITINDLFPFSHGDKNRFSGYNEDQKRVLKAYDSWIKPDINYLFFIPDGAETNGVAGYNPLGYNFGFIYYGAGNRTIAHELAHGIASLNHPFKDDVETKGQTDNLLDYNDGNSLWHFQWDNLQNPPSRIFKWNFEEEDAEMSYFKCITQSNNSNLEKIHDYILPNNAVIHLPDNLWASGFIVRNDSSSNLPMGSLSVVTDGNFDYQIVDFGEKNHVYFGRKDGETIYRSFDLVSTKSNNPANDKSVASVVANGNSFIIKLGNISVTSGFRACKFNAIDVSSHTYFASINDDEYVKYHLNNNLKDTTKRFFYEDETVIHEFVNSIREQEKDRETQDNDLGEHIADKLRAYKNLNNKRFVVVRKAVNSLTTNQIYWDNFAEKVFHELGLHDDDILITLPYFECSGVNQNDVEFVYMPGLYYGNNVEIDISKLRSDYNSITRSTGTIEEVVPIRKFVMDVFIHTKKILVDHIGVINNLNDVEYSIKRAVLSGYDYNQTIILKYTGNFDSFIKESLKLYTKYDSLKSIRMWKSRSIANEDIKNSEIQSTISEIQSIDNEIIRLCEQQLELNNNIQLSSFVDTIIYNPKKPIIFKEEFIASPNIESLKNNQDTLSNAAFYILTEAFNEFREDINNKNISNKKIFSKTEGFGFNGDHTFTSKMDWYLAPYDGVIYASIDVSSVVLGFFGLDFISDFMGVSYSLIRKDYTQTSLYTLSLGVSGPVAISAIKNVKNVKIGQAIKQTHTEISVVDDVKSDLKKIVGKDGFSAPTIAGNPNPKWVTNSTADVVENTKSVNKVDEVGKTVKSEENIKQEVNTLKNTETKELAQEAKTLEEAKEVTKSTTEVVENSINSFADFESKMKSFQNSNEFVEKVKGISQEQQSDFFKMFGNLDDVNLQRFVDNPGMVDAWKSLKKTKLDESYLSDVDFLDAMSFYKGKFEDKISYKNIGDFLQPELHKAVVEEFYKKELNITQFRELIGDLKNSPDFNNGNFYGEMYSFVENAELKKALQGRAFNLYFHEGNDNLAKEFGKLSRNMQENFVSDFQKSKSFVKFKERPELLNLWKKLRSKNMPEYMYKDVEFLEKLNVSNLDISYINRTFCDDEMCEYLYKLIKDNKFDTKQLQALCGDFEHCVPKNGDGLLELFDFIKTDKNAALQNKAYAFYDKKYKTLRQKAIDYFVEKTPDFVNAFAQEFVANIVVNTLKFCTDSIEVLRKLDSKATIRKIETYINNLFSSVALYESCLRNVLNTFSSNTNNKWNSFGIKLSFISGISYTSLLDPKKSIEERVSRAVYQGIFGIITNIFQNNINKWRKAKIPFVNSVGEQILFDGLESYSEDYLISIFLQ